MSRNIVLPAVLGLVLVSAIVYLAPRFREFAATAPAVRSASAIIDPPSVMFRTLWPKDMHGRIGMVQTDARESTRYVAELSCARVAYAAGSGLCLIEEPAGTTVTHAAFIFNRAFTRGRRIDLSGIPTRARVSPDGRIAAITVYGEEHLPGGEERLASWSVIVDVAAGRVVADLRDFKIDRGDGPAFEGPLDFSSVAFAHDSNRFFATVTTTAERYIVAGLVDARRMTVVASGLASEALSPDAARLVAKQRVGDRGRWQVVVFDLGTKNAWPLNQGDRSVDDQVEWLDGEHVVYHDATDQGTHVWALSTDGVTPPRLLVRDAYSPSVQH